MPKKCRPRARPSDRLEPRSKRHTAGVRPPVLKPLRPAPNPPVTLCRLGAPCTSSNVVRMTRGATRAREGMRISSESPRRVRFTSDARRSSIDAPPNVRLRRCAALPSRQLRAAYLVSASRAFASTRRHRSGHPIGSRRTLWTRKPRCSRRSLPPRSERSTIQQHSTTRPPHRCTREHAASAVPPVAIRSSTTNTDSSGWSASTCISMRPVPYSSW